MLVTRLLYRAVTCTLIGVKLPQSASVTNLIFCVEYTFKQTVVGRKALLKCREFGIVIFTPSSLCVVR